MSWMNLAGERTDGPRTQCFAPENHQALAKTLATFLIHHDGWTQGDVARLFNRDRFWIARLLREPS